MSERFFKDSYEKFLVKSMENGLVSSPVKGVENRIHPRFNLCNNIIWSNEGFQFAIANLSVSGIAFDSDKFFEEGQEITFRLGDLISVKGRVVRSKEMDQTSMFFVNHYLVHCEFKDEAKGTQFLVLVKDIGQIRIEM